jgi:hypothetical protein
MHSVAGLRIISKCVHCDITYFSGLDVLLQQTDPTIAQPATLDTTLHTSKIILLASQGLTVRKYIKFYLIFM